MPFAIIDCSRQNESVKNTIVDVCIEFDCKENVPDNTTAYCLILYDHVFECCPLSNVVRKIMYIAKSTCIWNFKRERKIEVKYSLEEFDVMVILTFVDLQRFVVNKKFIVNEVEVLKQRTVLTYTFYESCPWKFLTRFDRFYAS